MLLVRDIVFDKDAATLPICFSGESIILCFDKERFQILVVNVHEEPLHPDAVVFLSERECLEPCLDEGANLI